MAVNGILLGQTGNFANKTLSNIEPASTTETTRAVNTMLVDTAASTLSNLNETGGWYFYNGTVGQISGGDSSLYSTISFTASNLLSEATSSSFQAVGNNRCFYTAIRKLNGLKYIWQLCYGNSSTSSLTQINTYTANAQYSYTFQMCVSEPFNSNDSSMLFAIMGGSYYYYFLDNTLKGSGSISNVSDPFCITSDDSVIFCNISSSTDTTSHLEVTEYTSDGLIGEDYGFILTSTSKVSAKTPISILQYSDMEWYVAIGKDVYLLTYYTNYFNITTSPLYSFDKNIVSLYNYLDTEYVVFEDGTVSPLKTDVVYYSVEDSSLDLSSLTTTHCKGKYFTSSNNIYCFQDCSTSTETTAPFKNVLSDTGFATSDYLDTL